MKIYSRSNSGSRGIAALALVVIVVVIVVAAGVGGYAYYASISKSSTTTATGTPASSTTTTTATGSSSSSMTTGSSSSSYQLLGNVGDVIGNFSSLEISYNSTIHGTTSGALSYVAISVTNSSNDLKLTVVNYTESATVNGTVTNLSYLIYYNSAWTPLVVSSDGINFTGSTAQSFATGATAFYSILFNYQNNYVNSTVLSQLTKGSTSTKTFGTVQMSVTPYTASTLTEDGQTVNNFEVDIGSIPSTSFSMVTLITGTIPSGSGAGTFTLNLVSATLT